MSFTFTILAQTRPKQRHRTNTKTGHTYTPKKTEVFEQIVRNEWERAGCIRLSDGPILLVVTAYFPRPKYHFNAKGELNKKGLEAIYPIVHPDWDNIGKIVSDALNKFAWHDDKQIAIAITMKKWGDPKVVVHAREITARLNIGVSRAVGS